MAVIGSYTQDGGFVSADGRYSVPASRQDIIGQIIADAQTNGDTITAYVAPVIDLNAIDVAAINDALTQPGSVLRALGLLTLQEINKLRVIAGQQAYTLAQFQAALKAQIR